MSQPLVISALVSLLTLAPHVDAKALDTEVERALLAQIIAELDAVYPLLDAAKEVQDPTRRIQFDYAQLHADITAMQRRIAHHMKKARAEPRTIRPIKGNNTLH